jgi:hypothetical protein
MIEQTRAWVLVYKSAPAAESVAWVVIAGVPRNVHRADLLERLEGWSRWPQWQARMQLGSTLTARRLETSADGLIHVPGLEPLKRFSDLPVPVHHWENIAPETVRVSIPLEGGLHARVTRAARAAGMPVTEWAAGVLEAAAAATL